jgi:hypothetical protein
MYHCRTCARPGLQHEDTARDPQSGLWRSRWRCPACGTPRIHTHSPAVSSALDAAQAALDAGEPLPTVGRD